MLEKQKIYENIGEKDIKKILHTLQSTTLLYKNNQSIAYSIGNRNIIGIIEEGNANLIRFDFDGKRTIIEEMSKDDIFSDMFLSTDSSELSVVATTNCKVTFIEYNELIKECTTNNKIAPILLNNLIQVMSRKLIKRNERIELLTRRSIRDKLLHYFELEGKKANSKTFNLNYSYTDLADYLSVDRSAMMRELKNLKDDKLIQDINKKITILY